MVYCLSRCRRYVSTAIALSVIVLFPQLSLANTLYFPHVVVGGGYTTSFVIMNTGRSAVTAPVVFYNQDGSVNTAYQRSLNIPAGGSVRFATPSSGPLVVTWVKVSAGSGTVQGVVTFEQRESGRLVLTAGVLGTDAPGNSFVLPVDVADPTLNTGVAIANVTSSAINVQLRFIFEDGTPFVIPLPETRLQPLGANRQFSDFVTKFFPAPPGLNVSGTLIVEAAAGSPPNSLAVTALTVKEGLLSAIPVIPVPASLVPPVSVARASTTDTNNVEQTSFTVGQTVRLVMTRNSTLAQQVNVSTRYRATGPSAYILADKTFSSDLTYPGVRGYYTDVPIPQNAPTGSYTFEATLTYNGITTNATSTFTVGSGSLVLQGKVFAIDGTMNISGKTTSFEIQAAPDGASHLITIDNETAILSPIQFLLQFVSGASISGNTATFSSTSVEPGLYTPNMGLTAASINSATLVINFTSLSKGSSVTGSLTMSTSVGTVQGTFTGTLTGIL